VRVGLVALVLVAAGCQDNETAIARGDRLWADSAYAAAMAEYRLAVAQRGDEEALARLAHAFARNDELSETRETYDRLLAIDPGRADQAVYDYLWLVDRSLGRGDEYGAAVALEEALALRPGLQLPEAVPVVARFHRERGDLDRAVAFYRRALTLLQSDSTPQLLYELGLVHEERGDCSLATDYYRAFQEHAVRAGEQRWRALIGEARWHTGNCAFRLAREARSAGRAGEALSYLEQMIDLGEPENLLDQAWFERGELLYGVGRFEESLEAYRMVLERNPARTGQLVERARRRIDDIRFGVGLPADTTQ
jgi:tetratricopeptide (TPR) repeat protein